MNVVNLVTYLRRLEWSMGNGQCPECAGHPDRSQWRRHPAYLIGGGPKWLGHEPSCILAACLRDLGEVPLMKGDLA